MGQTVDTFRALHEAPGAFIIPNPWDAGSARLLAAIGFKALATTSAGMAHAHGLRDGAMTRDLVLDHCRTIVAATPLPVSADLEKGFGDSPEAVHETILAAAEIGLAGCSIEDHTGDPAEPIFDHDLAVERIAAASQACRSLADDFVLTARCDSFLWGGDDLDAVIARLQDFQAPGADVLYAPGINDIAMIRTVCDALDKPVNVTVEAMDAAVDMERLAEAGVRRISMGSALALLSYGALLAAAREMAEHETFGFLRDIPDFAEVDAYFR
ncbi:MAG: isocitrate lyase/phosphoenolpyruvate mutase family protein [Pseudomonadota bacterium]